MTHDLTPSDSLGGAIMSQIEQLATYSELANGLSRRYLSPEHRKANDQVGDWMQSAGMNVRQDEIGNIIGRYEGTSEGLPAVMIGSHLDTVVMAGKYDGMLGVTTGIACVEELNRQGKRLPFAIEIIGFADEEGVRFQSTYLGSRALTGNFDTALLERKDEHGITMAQAMTEFGLDPLRVGDAARQKKDILAYLELHIEQGPVLESENLPVGVVTSIAGANRMLITLEGVAGHAGTVPMGMRQDALAVAAECILAVETVCSEGDNVVGTVGKLTTEPGAVNVIPGDVQFTLDLRAAKDENRIKALEKVSRLMVEAARRRGVKLTLENTHQAVSVPCDDNIMNFIDQAITESGWPVRRLPSGAGHDAAAMAEMVPAGMLFIRCKDGISHSPAEDITIEDALAGARVMFKLLSNLDFSS